MKNTSQCEKESEGSETQENAGGQDPFSGWMTAEDMGADRTDQSEDGEREHGCSGGCSL